MLAEELRSGIDKGACITLEAEDDDAKESRGEVSAAPLLEEIQQETEGIELGLFIASPLDYVLTDGDQGHEIPDR